MQFHIENMTCGGCAKSVAKVVASVDPQAKVDANPPSRTVTIETSASREDIEKALAKGGWSARAN